MISTAVGFVTVACVLVASAAPPQTAISMAPLRSIGAIHPRLSPDGESIAASYQGSIWRMGSRGGVMRRLTDGPGFDGSPAWSPDAQRIAYLSGSQLRLIDAVSGAPVPLPGAAEGSVQGSGSLWFHPGSKRLLGNLRAAGHGGGLAWLDLETGRVTPLLDPPRTVKAWCLSPDGEKVAFATSLDAPGEQDGSNGPQMDVWTVPSAGGEPAKLFRWRSRIYSIAWNAGELYFSTDLGGAHDDLWMLATADPARAHKLTSGQADEDSPSISADGLRLVYTDNREGATAFVLRDVTSGDEQILRVTGLDFGAPVGTLRIAVAEKGTGRPLTARVSLEERGEGGTGGKYLSPPGALYRFDGSLGHFYSREVTELGVPAGRYVLRAFRGLEYRPAQQEVDVAAGRVTEARVEIERWSDPQDRGWFGGESHIHANYGYGHWYNTPATMLLQVEGEGLNLANLVAANSDTDGVFDREFFRGGPDPASSADTVLYWNEEFRATLWGHLTLFNLKQLVEPIFTGFADTTNPWDVPTNADVAAETHVQGGHVNFTHPAVNAADPFASAYAAKSLPVEVALGLIDSLDINMSFEVTVPLWYRLLDCGFHLPASAGTDCFLNRIQSRLPGSDRAYVKVGGPFSCGEWVNGLRAGRSFVTNGPMLELEVAGKGLGETVRLEAAGALKVRGVATYRASLSRVELVHDGEVAATGILSGDRLRGSIEQRLEISRSGWLGLRAFATDGTQAHTSAIYLEAEGKPAVARKDAGYFLEWIDRLEALLRKRDRVPSPQLLARVIEQLDAARAVFRGIAARVE